MNNTRKDDAALTNAGVPPEEETLAQYRMRVLRDHALHTLKQQDLELEIIALRDRIREVEEERDDFELRLSDAQDERDALRLNQQIPPCPAKEQLEEAIARIRLSMAHL